jgi:hypothetical protein
MMAAAPHPVFRQKFCKAESCGARFFICSHCDHGQSYCSEECRLRSRREQHRVANRRHQQSPEGRDDHRDRQRAYRRRKAAISHALRPKVPPRHPQHSCQMHTVTASQASPPKPILQHQQQSPAAPLKLSAPSSQALLQNSVTDQSTARGATSAMLFRPCSQWPIEPVREPLRGFRVIVCRFCGRIGFFLNPYDEPG